MSERKPTDAEAIAQEFSAGSEFGAGVVVCLAKFSEHLWAGSAYDEWTIREFARWLEMSEAERDSVRRQAERYPVGDSARMLSRIAIASVNDDPARALSHMIEMWMNAASDHFYDLDRDRAPEPLRELADLTLRIGHGFTGETWTMEHVERIRELWKRSCLAVDRMLDAEPIWGDY